VQADLALITGASKGIGRSLAKLFANLRFVVLATARNENALKSLKSEIEKTGGVCHYICADFTQPPELERISAEIKLLNKKISVLVHNAGIAKVGKIESYSEKDWNETIATNLTAPFLLTKACFPYFGDHAHIFFINSVAGRQSFPEWSAYNVSKWGLRALADTLRQELSGTGIKVSSVYPSSVDTPMHDSLPYNWDRKKMLKDTDVAKAIIMCYQQSAGVQIKEIDIESLSGTF
jgi:3-oxoacyl-[acyl-carrier protein] reductase